MHNSPIDSLFQEVFLKIGFFDSFFLPFDNSNNISNFQGQKFLTLIPNMDFFRDFSRISFFFFMKRLPEVDPFPTLNKCLDYLEKCESYALAIPSCALIFHQFIFEWPKLWKKDFIHMFFSRLAPENSCSKYSHCIAWHPVWDDEKHGSHCRLFRVLKCAYAKH